MRRCLVIGFEHDRRTKRESDPPCLDLNLDVRVPWVDANETFEGTLARVGVLADHYQPVCPACKEPLRYVVWAIEDDEDES